MKHTGEVDGQHTDTAYADARRADIAADQRLLEALYAADAAGELVNHDSSDACSLGTWHTGKCQP
jgi:hypothetical protein